MYIVLSQGSASFLLSLITRFAPTWPNFQTQLSFFDAKRHWGEAQKVRRAVLVMPAPQNPVAPAAWGHRNQSQGSLFSLRIASHLLEFEIWRIPMIFLWFSYDIPNIGPDVFWGESCHSYPVTEDSNDFPVIFLWYSKYRTRCFLGGVLSFLSRHWGFQWFSCDFPMIFQI